MASPLRRVVALVLVLPTGCAVESKPISSGTEGTATSSTTESTAGTTTTSVEETTGIGTTFEMLPTKCPGLRQICAPATDTATGTGTDTGTGTESGTSTDTSAGTDTGTSTTAAPIPDCDATYPKLEEEADAGCTGIFAPSVRFVGANGECCVQYTCAPLTTQPGTACVPLAAANGCGGYDLSPYHIDAYCNLGSYSREYVHGDLCCIEFTCYCGDTG